MKTLKNLVIPGDLGAEVGDVLRLFLDQVANPGFPVSIDSTIINIFVAECASGNSYTVEYEEAGLPVPYIRVDDVVDTLLINGLAAEIANRIAADAVLQEQIDEGTGGGLDPIITAPVPLNYGMLVTGTLAYNGTPVTFPRLPYAELVLGRPYFVSGNFSVETQPGPTRWYIADETSGANWSSTENVASPELVTTWTPGALTTGVPILTPSIGTVGLPGQLAVVNQTSIYGCVRQTPVKWVQLSN